MKQNKDRAFTVRFTPEQFQYINEQAETAMMTPSNYIRAAAMHSKVNVLLDGKAIAKELNAIGRNLNQLTTLANMGKIDAIYLDKIHDDLQRLYRQFFEIAGREVR